MHGNLGWIPHDQRTNEQKNLHDAAVSMMPRLMLAGDEVPPVGTLVLLTDYWKHQRVVDAFGGAFPGIRQVSGSCIWAGGTNAAFTSALGDVLFRGDPEIIKFPHTLPNYGKSRLYGGLRGRGDGSFGSTWAKSLGDDGSGDAFASGRPTPTKTDQWCFGEAVEMDYSDGARLPEADLAEGRQHLWQATVPLRSVAEVRAMILARCAVTRASMDFVNPGTASVQDGVSIGTYNGRGGHQESWLGYHHHPRFGELFWEQNQWGQRAYTADPLGGPLGGCWVKASLVDRTCKSGDGEVYGIVNWNGFQTLRFTWET